MKPRIVLLATMAIAWSIVMLALPPALKAQEPPAEKLQHLSQVLNLSPQQKSQLAPILEAEAPKLQAIKENPSIPPKEKMKQLQAVHNQTDPLVKNILTPTQYKMWEQIRKDELDQIKQGGGM